MSGDPIPAAASEPSASCIACHQPIEADSRFCRRCGAPQVAERRFSGKKLLGWVAAVSAVLGLYLSLRQVLSPAVGKLSASAEIKEKLRVARSQRDNADYEGALRSYDSILRQDPRNKAATEARLEAVMARVRDFEVAGKNDEEISKKADAELAEMIPALESAIPGAEGSRLADVTAHLAWARHLKYAIAESAASDDAEALLRKALAADAGNVYANAMLGNYILRTRNGALPEAVRCFRASVDSGKEREWVRRFQLIALYRDDDEAGARAELVKALNEMRKSGESLPNEQKHEFLAIYELGSVKQLAEALSTVPPDESWDTFLWIDVDSGDADFAAWKDYRRKYIRANLDEVAGRKREALVLYQELCADSRYAQQTMGRRAAEAVKRLEKSGVR